jgi:hypothetical protein
MVSTIMRFDTLAWAKKLEKAGVPSAHAEAQVEILSKVIEANITTKQDLAEVRRDIILEIEKIKASLNAQIAKWVLGVSAVQATVLVSLIR